MAKNFLAISFCASVALEEIEQVLAGVADGVGRVALAALDRREVHVAEVAAGDEVAAVGFMVP